MHHMFAVGLDVDNLVFMVKILLYAGNSYIISPLIFIMLGTIYLFKGQSAGNSCFSKKASASTKNTYNKYNDLSIIYPHIPNKTKLTYNDFGYFLTRLIEADGYFHLNIVKAKPLKRDIV